MRLTLLLLRGAVSASILAVLLARIPLDEVLVRASAAAFAPLAAALALVLLMYLLVSLRWRILARTVGVSLPLGFAVRTVFLGLFGGQLLPATVGSDLVRGWAAARGGAPIRSAAASVLADRLVGLFAACLLLALASAALGTSVLPFAALLVPAAVVASGVVLVVFLLACKAALQPLPLAAATLAALAIHAIHVLAAALCASAYGVDASLAVWFAVLPVAIVACAVPVSINGWGVREAAIVALAGGQGIAASDALVVSLSLGVLNTLASLPGAYLLFVHGDR